MRKSTRNEVAAGLFVLVAIAATLGVVLWLGAAEMFKSGGQVASFCAPLSEGSMGLQEGADVLLGDSGVGKIIRIDSRPGQGVCLYHARIDRRDLVIRADGSASIVSPPIGTAKLVITRLGSGPDLADDAHPILLAGGLNKAIVDLTVAAEKIRKIAEVATGELDASNRESILYRVKEGTRDLVKASSDVAMIAANVRGQTDANQPGSIVAQLVQSAGYVRGQLDPNQGGSIMDTVRGAAGSVKGQLDANQKESLAAKFHRSVDDVNAMTSDARPKVQKTLTAIADMTERLDGYVQKDVAEILGKLRETNNQVLKIAKDFAEISDQTRKMILVSRDKIGEMIGNMTLVSEDLKATAKEVRRNPWRLFYQPKDKELETQNILDAARAFMQGAEQLDAALARMNELAKLHPEGVKPDDPELQKVRESLKDTFGKFSKVEQALWKELEKSR